MAGPGRRFALEAAFLVALAVTAGLAGLSAGQIIGVMALGWLLTTLVELVSWRLAGRYPAGLGAAPPVEAAPERPVAEVEPVPREPADEPAQPEEAVEAQGAHGGDDQPEERDEEPERPGELAQPAPAGDSERAVGATEAAEAAELAERDEDAAAAEASEPVVAPAGGDRTGPARRPSFWQRRRSRDVDTVAVERPSPRHVRVIPPAADAPDDRAPEH